MDLLRDHLRDRFQVGDGSDAADVARLESGRSMPSTRTLERFAKATGTRLRITFEQEKPTSEPAHR